jgi:Na+-driven multidrug efflux pump
VLEASLQLPESKIEASRHDLRDDTVKYIRWEMVAAVIQGLERFTHVIFVLLKRDKVILLMTLLQALLTVFFDYIFVSDLPGSLRVGVIGVAWSNICILARSGTFVVVEDIRNTVPRCPKW